MCNLLKEQFAVKLISTLGNYSANNKPKLKNILKAHVEFLKIIHCKS